jgi:antitoxin YefM
MMTIQTTYTEARANLAKLCDQVTADLDVAIISRRGAEDVALISASELSGILETAHLLRSPKNADRLLSALRRAQKGTGKPQAPSALRRELDVNE